MTRWTGALGWGDPDALGGGAAEGDGAGGGGESESLVVVAFEEAELCRRPDAAGFEKFEKTTIAFVNAADQIICAGSGIREEGEPAMAPAGGAFHLAEIAVGADAVFAELGEEFGLEIGGDGVLETLGFVVDLPPLHTEKLGEHAFDEVVAEGKLAGDFAAGGGKADVTVGEHANEAVFLETTKGHGDGRSGHFEPIGKAGGDYGLAFALGFEDGFEVILFGDGDHLEEIIRGLSEVKVNYAAIEEASQDARLLRRIKHDASRGSPRSFASQKALAQDDNAFCIGILRLAFASLALRSE
jgi:hypothetical protein